MPARRAYQRRRRRRRCSTCRRARAPTLALTRPSRAALRCCAAPQFPEELAGEVEIFFSAHGVPVSYIEEGARAPAARRPPPGSRAAAGSWSGPLLRPLRRSGRSPPHKNRCCHVQAIPGPTHSPRLPHHPCLPHHPRRPPPGDPYKEEMEECVELVMGELRRRGVPNHHTLAYQSRVGPVEWLKPYTDDSIRCAPAAAAAARGGVLGGARGRGVPAPFPAFPAEGGRRGAGGERGRCDAPADAPPAGPAPPPRSPCAPRSELAQSGVRGLLAVPISFVSEHIETLEEIDCEYR